MKDGFQNVFEFGERILRGEFDMMIFLTGVGARALHKTLAIRERSATGLETQRRPEGSLAPFSSLVTRKNFVVLFHDCFSTIVRLAAFSSLALTACAQSNTFAGLRFRELPDVNGMIVSVNDLGDVLYDAEGISFRRKADGTITQLPQGLTGKAINNRSQILGMRDGFPVILQPDGTIERRSYLGAPAIGSGLNNLGEIAGFVDGKALFWDAAGVPKTLNVPLNSLFPFPPYVDMLNGAHSSALNDRGAVAGSFLMAMPIHMFLRTPDGFYSDVARSVRGFDAMGISNAGTAFYTFTGLSGLLYYTSDIRDFGGSLLYRSSIRVNDLQSIAPLFRAISLGGGVVAGNRARMGYGVLPDSAFLAESCPAEISPGDASLDLSGGRLKVSVSADSDCHWYFEQDFQGSQSLDVNVPSAAEPVVRHFIIAGNDFVVRQGESACDYSIPGEAIVAGSSDSEFRLPISTAQACPWMIRTSTGLEARPASGIGPGEATILVAANPLPTRRPLDLEVGGRRLRVYQDAPPAP